MNKFVFFAILLMIGFAFTVQLYADTPVFAEQKKTTVRAGYPSSKNGGLSGRRLDAGNDYTSFQCSMITLGEVFVPGLGYIITGQYAKTALIGGVRWGAGIRALNASKSVHYQEEGVFFSEKADETKSGKDEIVFNYNRETWDANFFLRVNFNLTLYSIWDLHEKKCRPHQREYEPFTAIFRPNHYARKWQFWLPVILVAVSVNNNDTNYTWYLGNNLKKRDVMLDSIVSMYTVGIGEETFFRGFAQKAFYNFYKDHFSETFAHHAGVASASALFGVAHDGSGTSASAAVAFGFGIYLGYVFQPAPNQYDLITPIAIHTFWNTILVLHTINNGKFHESDDPVEKERTIPISNVYFQF